jgi:serine/threonine-protein kinase HipA
MHNLIHYPLQIFERVRQDAQQLRTLPDLLRGSGLPDVTFNHPAIALGKLERRLKNWGLL